MSDRPKHSRSPPSLETHREEEENWETNEQEYDPYDAYGDGQGQADYPREGQEGGSNYSSPFLNFPNRSTHSIGTPHSGNSGEMPLPTPDFSGPPPEYDSAVADFDRMRISDPHPVARTSSPGPLYPDDPHAHVQRDSGHSLNGDWRHQNQPNRALTMPPTPEAQSGWTGPPRSASVANRGPARGYSVPDLVVNDRTSPDAVSVYSNGSGQSGYASQHIAPAPGAYQSGGPYSHQYYGAPAGGWQPPPQQYAVPYVQPAMPPAEYNPLYAAASEMLGPPPGAQAPVAPAMPYGAQMPPGAQNLAPYPAGGLYRGPSVASSMRSGFSAGSGASSGASLARSATSATTASMSPTLNTRKTKAIDANQPPFTKDYIDQYRARLKADPDPEAHFKYAKYLLEAAKKVGASAADQKAVRKYRDSLIGEAIKVIRKLATQGETYPEAQFFLANCYGTGMLGLQIDHEKAYHLYLQAAKQNHSPSCYRVAVCNELGAGTRRDHSRAFAFYRKAASLGDTPAMYKLGMVLLTGQLGQPRDEREAITWLKRAAEQADEENPHALHELGLLHESAETKVVIHDEAYARELFTKAGNLGYTKSCLKLGSCYEYGTLTCPVDPKRSIAWYTRAAEKGDPEAELALSGWYLTGCEAVLKQSDHEAYLWARKAANKGLPKAEYAVGYYAEVGIGIKPDIEFARRWYLRAAAQGHVRSKERLTQLKIQSNKRLARPTRQQAKDECVIM